MQLIETKILFLLLILLWITTGMIALSSGSAGLDMMDIWLSLRGGAPENIRSLVLDLRLPRALTAFAVGGLLAVAGVLMQALLRNPLAEPYILGTSGGAAVAALLAMMAGLGAIYILFSLIL